MGARWDNFFGLAGGRVPQNESEYQQLCMRLGQRFSELTPIDKAPPLGLHRGSGLRVIGKRDADADTASYVKNFAFVLFFVIPVFYLRAYRVQDASHFGRDVVGLNLDRPENDRAAIARWCEARSDWYFIGREPLSNAARAWNIAISAGIALFFFQGVIAAPLFHKPF